MYSPPISWEKMALEALEEAPEGTNSPRSHFRAAGERPLQVNTRLQSSPPPTDPASGSSRNTMGGGKKMKR